MNALWTLASLPLWLAALASVLSGCYALAAVHFGDSDKLYFHRLPGSAVVLFGVLLIAEGSGFCWIAVQMAEGRFAW